MIEQTFDFRRVNRLAAKPPIISMDLVFLVEKLGGQDIGLWTLHKFANGFMIHADMGNACRGRDAISSAKSAFQWSFKNLKCDFIYAIIPKHNRPACHIAVKAGMKFVKEIPKGIYNRTQGRFYKVKNHG